MFYFGQHMDTSEMEARIQNASNEADKLTHAVNKICEGPDPFAALLHNLRGASLKAKARRM